MRSCVLALAWLGAVLLLALQRGSGAKATPAVATSRDHADLASTGPRLTRLTRQEPSTRDIIAPRYARRVSFYFVHVLLILPKIFCGIN
jgi:hypothetical protein